jgi:putative pyruvate formate lyase activating enzyme
LFDALSLYIKQMNRYKWGSSMKKGSIPSYLKMDQDELKERSRLLAELASPCLLCPRGCGSLRREGQVGYCRTGFEPKVSSVHPHYGEEAPLVGRKGSGTIFLTNCNLGCIFCQNEDISHFGRGQTVTVRDLADAMLNLQELGCHNINFVTPTHQIHAIVEGIVLARGKGLTIPLVYNTGSYDSVQTLRLVDGIFDIYMPDLKFTSGSIAAELADAPDYPSVSRLAIREMHRQVGNLVIDGTGVAVRGLLVRHLVLPHALAGTEEAFRFIAEELSTETYLNVMAQYHPCHEAVGQPGIGAPLDRSDYLNALDIARKWGLNRLD